MLHVRAGLGPGLGKRRAHYDALACIRNAQQGAPNRPGWGALVSFLLVLVAPMALVARAGGCGARLGTRRAHYDALGRIRNAPHGAPNRPGWGELVSFSLVLGAPMEHAACAGRVGAWPRKTPGAL
jgi:hypothetical protein